MHLLVAGISCQHPDPSMIASCGYVEAAVLPAGYFLDVSTEHFRRLMDINYLGVVHVLKATLPAMIARNQGQVVVLGSPLGCFGEWEALLPWIDGLLGRCSSLPKGMVLLLEC